MKNYASLSLEIGCKRKSEKICGKIEAFSLDPDAE